MYHSKRSRKLAGDWDVKVMTKGKQKDERNSADNREKDQRDSKR